MSEYYRDPNAPKLEELTARAAAENLKTRRSDVHFSPAAVEPPKKPPISPTFLLSIFDTASADPLLINVQPIRYLLDKYGDFLRGISATYHERTGEAVYIDRLLNRMQERAYDLDKTKPAFSTVYHITTSTTDEIREYFRSHANGDWDKGFSATFDRICPTIDLNKTLQEMLGDLKVIEKRMQEKSRNR